MRIFKAKDPLYLYTLSLSIVNAASSIICRRKRTSNISSITSCQGGLQLQKEIYISNEDDDPRNAKDPSYPRILSMNTVKRLTQQRVLSRVVKSSN